MEEKTKDEISVPSTEQPEDKSVRLEKKEEEEKKEVNIMRVPGRQRSSSYIDPVEASDFWKLYKEAYVTLKSWEDEQRVKAKEIKNLLWFLCDSLILSMSRTNASNQSLINYFTTVGSYIKGFANVTTKSISHIDPIIAYHSFTGKHLAELFIKLKGANNEFTVNLKELGVVTDDISNELKNMAIDYAKKLSEIKEYKPQLLIVYYLIKYRK